MPPDASMATGIFVLSGWIHTGVAFVTRIASGMTEPAGLVLMGLFVIGFSWLVKRKLSRTRS